MTPAIARGAASSTMPSEASQKCARASLAQEREPHEFRQNPIGGPKNDHRKEAVGIELVHRRAEPGQVRDVAHGRERAEHAHEPGDQEGQHAETDEPHRQNLARACGAAGSRHAGGSGEATACEAVSTAGSAPPLRPAVFHTLKPTASRATLVRTVPRVLRAGIQAGTGALFGMPPQLPNKRMTQKAQSARLRFCNSRRASLGTK